MINTTTKETIKGYLEGFIESLLDDYRTEARREIAHHLEEFNAPPKVIPLTFHQMVIPPAIIRISSFEKALSERLDITLERCIHFLLASQSITEGNQKYLDKQTEIPTNEASWTSIGGEGTYAELLEIYREVGREKGKAMIDALVFGF
jgi:hypothetical protein